MAYEKNTWASGDTVTSAKLNNIEDGIKSVDTGLAAVPAAINSAKFVQGVTIEQQDGEDVTEDWMTGKAYKYNGSFPDGFMAIWGANVPTDYAIGQLAGGQAINTATGQQLEIYESTDTTVTLLVPNATYQKLTVTKLDAEAVAVVNMMIQIALMGQ